MHEPEPRGLRPRRPRRAPWRWLQSLLPVLALGGMASGCAVEPMTGRTTLALISESETNAMGIESYKAILQKARVSRDPAANELVRRVGSRIARVTDRRMHAEGRELYRWEFTVIDDPGTVNAFALPGGKVAVYTGLLPIAKTEAGLAVVLGHEVAHAYAQHGRKRISEQVLAKLGLSVVDAYLAGDHDSESSRMLAAALGLGYKVGVELPFSRADESAADEIGLTLMAEAGYDPREAIPFWRRMRAAGGGGTLELLSTHPAPASRIARIRELLPEAMRRYEASKR